MILAKTKEEIKNDYLKRLTFTFAEDISQATLEHKYFALGKLIKDYLTEKWAETNKIYRERKVKQTYYFSMEFLIGRLLETNLINLGIRDLCEEALKELGINFNELVSYEEDAGLGNGGLGRLAACFIDSMASLSLPAHGNGIRFKHGLFKQKIENGYQVEQLDDWLKKDFVWEIKRADKSVDVRFGGNVYLKEVNGKLVPVYENPEIIRAVPYDVPVPGYQTMNVNTLRLWSADMPEKPINLSTLQRGEYLSYLEQRYSVEEISQVLYPDDTSLEGKRLRLKQEYFFTSAGIQSIVRSFLKLGEPITELHNYVAIHINDTHPAVAVAELMRILLDDYELDWDTAWRITVKTCAYTNHTIMAEALEKWDVNVFKKLLPRIYMIIEEINRRFCQEVADRYYNDWGKVNNMSIIQYNNIKMANLAIVGSHSINGVAWLHTEILKNRELKDFYEMYPDRFNNKTNGITHRRWLVKANRPLTDLFIELYGGSEDWLKDTSSMKKLLEYKDDKKILKRLAQIKADKKLEMAKFVKEQYGITIDPKSIFDVQVKRLHAYKRQLLNLFHIMYLYNELKANPNLDIVPRTFFFGAKAAPGYSLAKQVIKLINTVAEKINNDKSIKGKIKVVFLENYGVSLAEKIIPAGDVSEQISTASKEASGTGNMKFMMNGAITLATLDGANVEIDQAVGRDNIVVFGLTSQEVMHYNAFGGYNMRDVFDNDPRLQKIIDQITNGYYGVNSSEFSMILDDLFNKNDEFFVLKDFDAYVKAQEKIDRLYRDQEKWQQMCLINIANSGIFSSDNTIRRYADEIWNIKSCDIPEVK
ncbi:glycogen/starch/alpha-glucan phosphorylase [Fusobacterium perfoetens]|uniref:glycogen/starch/alpha-glucan phosphorylase n=1 Tax=Fusobacterium perfoetens TaxID=852 RepID=UPI001F2F3678|nr:glycogen/starch/alpha-glucan phosphorylase [Fusobacterium perfoetens]MCF2612557.1 glycogen/starch/alpha-glucan phosphorylase [Fusobacterium perfoetens]